LYTWHELDGQNVNGTIEVNSTALAAQQIQLSDVISFSFSADGYSFATAGLNAYYFPIAIFPPTGAFEDLNRFAKFLDDLDLASSNDVTLTLSVDGQSMSSGGAPWTIVNAGQPLQGVGNWTVAPV
jgi:hypothetical protein